MQYSLIRRIYNFFHIMTETFVQKMDSFISMFGFTNTEGVWTQDELHQHQFFFLKSLKIDNQRRCIVFEPTGYLGNLGVWTTLDEIYPPLFNFSLQFDAHRGVVCTYGFEDAMKEGHNPLCVISLLLCDGAYTLTLLDGYTKMVNRIARTDYNLKQGRGRASHEIRALKKRLNMINVNNNNKRK